MLWHTVIPHKFSTFSQIDLFIHTLKGDKAGLSFLSASNPEHLGIEISTPECSGVLGSLVWYPSEFISSIEKNRDDDETIYNV